MTPSKENEILGRNGDFKLRKEGGHVLFVHKSGQKAATDALGGAIWAAIPGTTDEVIRKVTEGWSVSADFVEDYLYLMRRAEVVKGAEEARKEEEKGGERKTAGREAGGIVAGGPAASDDLISVVVITHNGKDHVVDCLGSLGRQSYKNVEIIVVDNASSDGTAEIISTRFPEVRLLPQRRNLHYSGGVNVGLRQAHGKYVFVVNQDTETAADCLERFHEAMRADETIGAVVPMMKFFHLRGFVNGLGNQIRNHGWGTDNFIGHIDVGQFADLKEVPSACFGAVFLSRKALEAVGLLDESYGSFYEDVDWSFRCWMGGFRIVPQPKAVVYHKFGGSYLQRPKLKFVARNRQKLVLKLFQGKVMLGVFKRYLKEDARNFRELDVFRRNFGFYHAFDQQGLPRLDASILLGHYRWVLKKKV